MRGVKVPFRVVFQISVFIFLSLLCSSAIAQSRTIDPVEPWADQSTCSDPEMDTIIAGLAKLVHPEAKLLVDTSAGGSGGDNSGSDLLGDIGDVLVDIGEACVDFLVDHASVGPGEVTISWTFPLTTGSRGR